MNNNQKYTWIIFVLIVVLGFFIILISSGNKPMKYVKNPNIMFIALRKDKIYSLTKSGQTASDESIKHIINEMLFALNNSDINSFRRSEYFKYEEHFYENNTQFYDDSYITNRIIFLKNVLERISNKEDVSYILPKIFSMYRFYIASAIFKDAWFERPYIEFSDSFYREYIINNNRFIKNNNFFDSSANYFIKDSAASNIFGRDYDNLEYDVYKIPIIYAAETLKNREKITAEEYQQEDTLFYNMMQLVVDNKADVYIIEDY